MSFAALRLTLPNQGLQSNREMLALYRDILVDQVVETEDIGPKLTKIVPHLHNLNRMPLDGETRRALTEPLVRHYLPFSFKASRTNTSFNENFDALILECNRELTYATKLILRDCVSHSQQELAHFTYWAMYALADHLEDFSRQYRAQPGSIWGELNRLYQYARLRGVTEFQSNPPDQRDIESRYKQALLFAAAQPEHLSRSDQAVLTAYLQKWSSRAHLSHQVSRDGDSRYFYVDLESNQGIQQAHDLATAGNAETVLTLNPWPLIEQGRHHMKQIRRGLSPAKIGLPTNLDSIDLFMALKKAIPAWRQHGTRRFERVGSDSRTRVALGLHSIHHYLRLPDQGSQDLLHSRTVNQSKTGACIRLDRPSVELNVGDIIMHRDTERNREQFGIIRWMKRSNSGRYFGLEYLSGTLQPVAVKIEQRITEALLVSDAEGDSLITYKGYCTSSTPIRLKNTKQGLALEARVQSVIQRGQNVDQIRLQRQVV